jgi:hypothetical protein
MMMLHPDVIAARITLRVAELRTLAAETALAYHRMLALGRARACSLAPAATDVLAVRGRLVALFDYSLVSRSRPPSLPR